MLYLYKIKRLEKVIRLNESMCVRNEYGVNIEINLQGVRKFLFSTRNVQINPSI